jgi:hypothetical protein
VTRWDSAVSAGAWNDLVKRYREAGGAEASDFELAEILRQKMEEVEGDGG